MDSFRGTVEKITFRNEENFYTVAKMVNEDNTHDVVSLVGIFPTINVGETLRVTGKWEVHPEYGRQFKAETYQVEVPATLKGIEKYLGSGLIKGVGPVTARKLVDTFGENVLQVIEEEPERLQEIEGIGRHRAQTMVQSFRNQRQIQDIMIFLQSYGVSPGYAVRIFKHYGHDTVRIIQNDPYRLADDVFGIGFKTADKLAVALGLSLHSLERLTAGLKFVLYQLSNDGHTHVPRCQLLKEASKMLEVEECHLPEALQHLQQKQEVFIDVQMPLGGAHAIYLAPYYYAEVGVGRWLRNLAQWQMATGPKRSWDAELDEYQQTQSLQMAPEQRQAVVQALESGVMVITGGPGTGKTTIIRALLDLLSMEHQQVLLAAPTGRAAKRLSEATEREAKTIHRLLEYGQVEGGGLTFGRDEHTPLTADVVIIDEASMIDLLLMYNLVKAIPSGCKLVLVGDVDQLPSVGAGNVLRDIIDSQVIPTVRLKTIFRQAQESMIVVNAHRVNNGEFPLLNEQGKDFFFIDEEDPELILKAIIGLCQHRLPGYGSWHAIEDIQILTPMRRTLIGVENLNQQLQAALNPPMQGKTHMRYSSTTFRTGDKVMQTVNNYQKFVYNGDVGRILTIDTEQSLVQVAYPEPTGRRIIDYDYTELDELVLAYAISVHKSQGSEYNVVVMPVSTQHWLMLQRNLLYTGITRAKELVVLVGTKKALAIAVKNNKVEERHSLLARRLSVEI